MSLWSRIGNVFRGDRLAREIHEEMESHIADAIEEGRDPGEARRSLGPALRHREASFDARVFVWLESLRADVQFGWRQFRKNGVTSVAAVLSLGLAIGGCTASFRLIDALLWRALPVEGADRLYVFARQGTGPDGKIVSYDSCAHPMFIQMREAVSSQAELIAVSYAERVDLTVVGSKEIEKASRQYVSGDIFGAFGLKPSLGRLFTANDDMAPRAHALAVLSYDYWGRRFAHDPSVLGKTLRMGDTLFEIIGVSAQGFTGTEPGAMVDILVPSTMHPAAERDDNTWHRTLVLLKPGVDPAPVRDRLQRTASNFERERAKGFKNFPAERLAAFLNQTVVLNPAPSGVSNFQESARLPLIALAVLVGLVLLIACVNIANLMTARATARARELAMRVSIGAGRLRLVRLVLAESVWVAALATLLGALFAWWAAPFIAGRLNPPDNPAQLLLPADLRVVGFGLLLALAVTFLFGLPPALKASGVRPASVVKGGDDPRWRGRWMHGLIALQVAFCVVVLSIGALFIASYDRLVSDPTGFSAERLLVLDLVAERPIASSAWLQLSAHIAAQPGVESVALADQPLLGGFRWNGFISPNGAPPTDVLAFFRAVSPGWMDTMGIRRIDGRDFREDDAYPKVAIVNQTFKKTYFGNENPIGRWFGRAAGGERFEIVGIVADAKYANVRELAQPVAYFPFAGLNKEGGPSPRASATMVLRGADPNPLALASSLRQSLASARADIRLSNIRTQQSLQDAQTVRERLLAMLAYFFGGLALLLASVGLYGVLDYSVLQRRREIGIRMAIGAQSTHVLRHVALQALLMVFAGAFTGLLVTLASARLIETILYGVKASSPAMLVLPSLAMITAATLAAAPAAFRAIRTDPATTLRAD